MKKYLRPPHNNTWVISHCACMKILLLYVDVVDRPQSHSQVELAKMGRIEQNCCLAASNTVLCHLPRTLSAQFQCLQI